ncbi:MAG TPA: FdtA/QdtA family cupin domain-containing protein [Bacteroidales bacterium]|nr:FdtA/QdtA family cupin domain-containing protein [Bacteroidales bacterium]
MNLEHVKLIDIPSFEDSRGILSSIEQNIDIPFDIKRIFYVHHITGQRGNHAPMDTDEVLIPVAGSFHIRVYDKTSSKIYLLDNPQKGLYIPHLIYLEMYDFSENSVCLVLANTKYDPDKYLRTMDEYLAYVKRF